MFIDYLSMTIKNNDIKEINKIEKVISKYIKMEQQEYKNGINGYKEMIKYKNKIMLLYNGSSNMGIHIIISGKTLQELRIKNIEINNIVDDLRNKYETNISRIDITNDIITKDAFKHLLNKIKNNEYRSRLKTKKYILDDNERGTIYLGNRKSNTYIRIYDKALQMYELDNNKYKDYKDKNITRLEFQYRHKNAEKAYTLLKHNGINKMLWQGLKVVNELKDNTTREKIDNVYNEFFKIDSELIYEFNTDDYMSIKYLMDTILPIYKALKNKIGLNAINELMDRIDISETTSYRLSEIKYIDKNLAY